MHVYGKSVMSICISIDFGFIVLKEQHVLFVTTAQPLKCQYPTALLQLVSITIIFGLDKDFDGFAGALGFDTVCGVKGVGPTYAKGGGFDYITIPNGQCDYPSAAGTAVTTIPADRYCGTAFK